MYRQTYVEVDLDAIEKNVKTIKNTYTGYKYYFGVVKNNAYGHGIESINAMINGGINYLAVSSLEEALAIRKINQEIPVLVLEPIILDAMQCASENNITITIDKAKELDFLIKNNIKIKFHLKIDSGMNRFGVKNKEEVNYIIEKSSENQYLEGIYTHLSSGRLDNPNYENQINKFKKLTEDIDLSKIEIIHLDRSLTMEQHPKIEFANGVRLGIAMYGFAKRASVPSLKRRILNKIMHRKTITAEPKLKLETAFVFKTHVMEIKEIKKGEIVGYSGMYQAKKDAKIAILPYGFADYLYNNLTNVYIKGKEYKTIAINMDVTTIEIEDGISVGDEVEIFGDKISARRKAKEVNQNVYKLIASVTNRVPRVYTYQGKTKEIKY